jgi:hypothetical protein
MLDARDPHLGGGQRIGHTQVSGNTQIECFRLVHDGAQGGAIHPGVDLDEIGSRGNQAVHAFPRLLLVIDANRVRIGGGQSINHGPRGVYPWSKRRRRTIGFSVERGQKADAAVHIANGCYTPGQIARPRP